MKHTPGPYRAQGNKVKSISHGQWFTVADCATRGKWKHTKDGENDNAAFIAKACNNHDALLNALKRITEKATRANSIQHSGGTIEAEDWSELYALANEARAAINAAEGTGF
jgi:hypothetical protein